MVTTKWRALIVHSIKIVSDVSCPWCVIGYRALQSAIDELGLQELVKISWKPFELNPNMPLEGQDRAEHIQQKYGLSAEQAKANRKNLIDRGRLEDYEFKFADDGRVYNTFNAHRLIHWAGEYGLQTELKLALFDLYFQEGGNPSNEEDLLKCVEQVGLSKDIARQILTSDNFAGEVIEQREQNHQNGISAVPAFIFNNNYLVSGGQPKESFIQVLNELEKEKSKNPST